MGKLILAGIILVVGLAIHALLKRRGDLLPAAIRAFAQRVVLWAGIGIPAAVILFSIFRIIPAGHVGVMVLFGQVQPDFLREGLNVVNPLYDVAILDTRVEKHQAKYDAASQDLQ